MRRAIVLAAVMAFGTAALLAGGASGTHDGDGEDCYDNILERPNGKYDVAFVMHEGSARLGGVRAEGGQGDKPSTSGPGDTLCYHSEVDSGGQDDHRGVFWTYLKPGTYTIMIDNKRTAAWPNRPDCVFKFTKQPGPIGQTKRFSCAEPPNHPKFEAATVVDRSKCTVPGVKGKTVGKAEVRLFKAGCLKGNVTKKSVSDKSRRGKVLSQSKDPGKVLPADTKVKLVVGKK